jgi:hypothetical protein
MQLVGPKMCMFSHFVRVGKVFTVFFYSHGNFKLEISALPLCS